MMSHKILIAFGLLLVSGYFQTHSNELNEGHEVGSEKNVINLSKDNVKKVIYSKCGSKSNKIGHSKCKLNLWTNYSQVGECFHRVK